MKNISKEQWLRILVWIVVIAICMPFICAARYALFRADDFSNYILLLNQDGNSFLLKSIKEIVRVWKEWQGTHVSCFFLNYFNPLRYYSYRMLRLYLMGLLSVSFGGIIFLTYAGTMYYGVGKKRTIYFAALFLLPMLSYREYPEIYLWWTGAIVYLLPTVFLLYGLAFLMIGYKKRKKWMLVIAGILMAAMTGGVLEIVGLGTFLLLIILVIDYFRERKVNVTFLSVFIITVLGALSNALAPGNFSRHALIDHDKINIVNTIQLSCKAAFEAVEYLYRNTTFLVFVILAFALGSIICKRIDINILVFGIIGMILLPIVTAFPVVMGYSGGLDVFPNRCLFILDAAVILSSLGITILCASQLSACNKLPDWKTIGLISGIALVFACTSFGGTIQSYVPVIIATNFQTEKIQNYERQWRKIFEQIQHSTGNDVRVETEIPEYVTGCSYADVQEDAEHWANTAVAEYFGKTSVSLVLKDSE